MKSKSKFLGLVLGLVLAVALSSVSFAADSDESHNGKDVEKGGTRCRMTFYLESWSVFYRTGKGEGTVTCENGQKAQVNLKTHGGGVSFGKERIEGTGTFSKVWDLKEVYGGYTTSEAHASAHGASGSQAMWNGRVSFAIKGSGKGWSLGFAFGKFKISPK